MSDETDFWLRDPREFAGPDGAIDQGLTSSEAGVRLSTDGPNLVDEPPSLRILTRIGRRLIEPLVVILLVAAVVSGLTGDQASLFIILAIVAISVGLDVFQEHGAEKAAEALRRSIALTVDVRRDGTPVTLLPEQLVRGDVVALKPGDLVPADGIVLSSNGARLDEAILTGEPYPVEKLVGPSQASEIAEAYDALFSGTAVVSGTARMLVAATGRRTRFGEIAASLSREEPPAAFERGLRRLGLLIMRLTLALVLFVLLVQMLLHRQFMESVMFAVALAVGLTPELLPMVTTVTLSRGALRMAQKQVIVKRLAAIHDLGAMDVFCTDKTGTLTEARIELCAWPGPDGANSDKVLQLAAVNSYCASAQGNPLDEAILTNAPNVAGGDWRKLADLPFDFERRRSSVLVEQGDRHILIVKGAPEAILALSTKIDLGTLPQPLDSETRETLGRQHEDRAANGERLLGIAWKEIPADATGLSPLDEADLVFAGYCAFLDPPKATAAAAVKRIHDLGIKVKVISGDAAAVVRHLAGSIGMTANTVLTGEEITRLTDTALNVRLRHVDLFARVSPDQKTRIIHALSHGGHTVGYLGDGINDAPAIKAADAGLSVEGATDVARAAADMILLSNDLNVLADGVMEGRRTYANIIKYVRMGTSSNFGNMLSMALASLVIPFLPMTAVQILLNNLLYDFSQTGIPFDNVDQVELRYPHNWNIRAIEHFTVIMGPLSSVFDIATFAMLLLVFNASAQEFRTAWFLESMLTQILVIFVIRTRAGPWESRPHAALVTTSLGALVAALVLALGPYSALFGFAPLPTGLLVGTAILAAGYLGVAQLLKHIALRR
jgi:Mg2+-importing ATPase